MKLHLAHFRGLVGVAVLVLAAAAVAAGGLQLSIGVAQKIFRPAADKVAAIVHADGTQSYIVQFNSPAAAIYARGAGVETHSTESRGQRYLDVRAPTIQAYVRAMATQHAQFLTRAASIVQRPLRPRFDYHYALNGMAVRLTAAQVAQLRSLPNVKSIQPDRSFRPVSVPIPATATDTFPSRSWIGSAQLWALPTFNTGSGSDNEGEGVVVADLDTGINAANSSFAAAGADGYTIANPLGASSYLGVCNPANTAAGQPDTYQASFPCNSKLIGAYTYTLSTGNDANSPQDSEGHGSHTASIAAGDFTTATVAGIGFNLSGVAPHANIIAYDVCDPKDQCSESASIAAVDQAIQDLSALKTADPTGFKGMVINYSIGGSDDPYNDPVEQAFEAAEQAGIFVSAAAGNGGPANPPNSQTPGSQYAVQHLGPWVMTVAAGTHDGQFGPNNLENFSGGTGTPTGTLSGQGATGGFGPAPIVYAGNSAYTYSTQYYAWLTANYASQKYSQSGQAYVQPSGNAQTDAAQCLYPFAVPAGQTFTTPALPAGAIVLCDRGAIALVDKADDAKQGGAGAVVIATTPASSSLMVAEQYDIPGTLIDITDGNTLRNWITGSGSATLTAQLSGATYSSGNTSAADFVAGFSSRGPVGTYPATPNAFDSLIKPDVVTPGVSILGALADPCYTVTPSTCPDNQQETFGFLDGTSMATPHSTGAGALLMELHSSWDPMAIKSALMTTAVPDANLHDQCDAANATANSCTVTEPEPPTPQSAGAGRIQVNVAARAGFVLEETKANFDADNPDSGGDPTQINLPSLGNANCQASCTWARTLTSVQPGPLNYTVTSTVPWLIVSPTSFTLNPGATQTLTFTASMSGLTVNQWVFGRVDFTTSSTEPDGSAAPTQHFPVAAFNAVPQPKMGVSPSSFTQALTAGGSTQVQTLTIQNTGPGVLNWTLDSVASPAGSAPNPLMADAGTGSVPRASSPVPIVNRPSDSSENGVPSSYFTSDGHGLYSADTFSMPVAGSITSINAEGFAQSSTAAGAAADATQISWYVYADANGEPAGNPEDGKNDYLWSFTAAPTAPGVTTDTQFSNIDLDLGTAGAPVLNLSAGKYWLLVVPTFNDSCAFKSGSGCTNEAWYWFESAPGGGSGSLIDPGNLFGQAAGSPGIANWALLGPNTNVDKNATGSMSLAFELMGTLNCSGSAVSAIPGLSLSPTSGAVQPNSTGTVTVQFNPAALAAGSIGGVLCVLGNDPNTPFIVVPVTENVAAEPTVTNISPTSATAGGGAFKLTVNGTNFVNGAMVNFNGTPLTATFVSSTQLTATVPASAIASAGTYTVSVTIPPPGGGTFGSASFSVQSPSSGGGGGLGLLGLLALGLGVTVLRRRKCA